MPPFDEGSVVLYRPTSARFKVARWDQENQLLLVGPVAPHNDIKSSKPSSKSKGYNRVSRTRWIFEKDVVPFEKTARRTPASTRATAAETPTDSSPAAPTADTCNPTPYARRTGRLDKRVEFRVDPARPSRGRGLYALEDVPKGTEVMRMPAVGAVVSMRHCRSSCCGCFSPLLKADRAATCSDCGLLFCPECDQHFKTNGAGLHGLTCRFTPAAFRLCVSSGRQIQESVLRLSADILARKTAGITTDDEWFLLNSLESQDNEAGTIGLSAPALRECVKELKRATAMAASTEDVQIAYRRITRNMHNVTLGGLGAMPDTATALFPCGALVNHSCAPNAFIHYVSKKLTTGGVVVEQVTRTTRDVQRGEELCSSYLANFATTTVSERRSALECWGFQCKCLRCRNETEERKYHVKDMSSHDKQASAWLQTFDEWLKRKLRDGVAPSDDERDRHISTVLQHLSFERGSVSPSLRARLAMRTVEAVTMFKMPPTIARCTAFNLAAGEMGLLGDPQEVVLRYRQYLESKVLSGDGSMEAGTLLAFSVRALEEAASASSLYYGQRHESTLDLCRQRDTFKKQAQIALERNTARSK